MSDVEHILHPDGRVEVRKKPGASHAIDVREYISPFQLKPESFSHARKKYVNKVFDRDRWSDPECASTRALYERMDLEDLHHQWTREREKYATSGDLGDLLRMLDFVTAENPPEKSPAKACQCRRGCGLACLLASIFRRS